MWTFVKNAGHFLLGLTLVPLAWYLVGSASAAILGLVRPGWEYDWSRFSPSGKLLVGAAVDIAFAVAAVRVLWTDRKFAAVGVLCAVAIDFVVLVSR